MATSPIKFGTSGWRGLIADDFTFANVRLAVTAIAEHAKAKAKDPAILVGYDTRFYSEEFSQLAVDILQHHGIRTLLCETFAPTPAVAFEIMRCKLDGAINFTASHNPAQYHGLKFSSADAGPALPEVTKDIEARAAKLAANGGVPPLPHGAENSAHGEKVNLRENYLKRLEELVQFDTLRKAKPSLVVDALHGCGAGYLDCILTDHGVAVQAMRTERDCLFDGTGPDVSEENLAPLRKVVVDSKATAGLATDGDADRFGIVDRDGTWIQPNLILALVYDYLVETRKWKMPAARSVATTQMIDAVAKSRGQTIYQTPVGFKYIGQLIREDKIALGGEESAGLTIRGHIPEKDGILACLLVAYGQPRAFFAAQRNLIFADELADVLEADRRLMDALAVRFCDGINHLRCRHAARRRHLPLARFRQVVIDKREDQVRLHPRAVAVTDSKAVRVSIGCQPRRGLRIDHDLFERSKIFFGHVGPGAVEQTVATRSDCRHGHAVITEGAVQVARAASVKRVYRKFQVRLFQRFEAHEFLEPRQIVLP